MILLGTDLSFTKAGIALLDTTTKEILLDRMEGQMHKDFHNVWREGLKRCKTFNEIIKGKNIDYYISEHPFPGGDASPGLYLLDSMVFYTAYLAGIPNVYVLHPSYLRAIHKGKYTKGDSVNLYKDLKEIYIKHGYTFNKNRVCNDEAEAFIFLTRLLVLLNVDSKLISDIVKLNKVFADKKEKVLYERGINNG